MPPTYDLTFYAGDTESFVIGWNNSDGTPVAGMEYSEARMAIKINFKDTPILEKVGVIDSVTGVIRFDFTQAETDLLMGDDDFAKKSYRYDVQLEIKDALSVILETKTIIRGLLVVVEDVTKA